MAVGVLDPKKGILWQQPQAMTPDQIAELQALEARRSMQGIDTSPVGDWTQGAARVVDALGGVLRQRRIEAAAAENQAYNSDLLNGLLGGSSSSPAAVSMPTQTGAGAEMAAISPRNDPVGEVLAAGGNPSAATNWLQYANEGATRNQPLSPDLVKAMSFLPEMGVSMKVFSGGQDAEGPNRTGSHRHDHGGAGDVFFYKDGRQLDWANKDDLPVFQDIVRRARASGVTGFGAGDGYMQPGSMHLGFGTPAVWGAGGSGANAPDWLRTAFNSPSRGTTGQVASASPQAAIEAVAPQSSQPLAPPLPAPTTIAPSPAVASLPGVQVAGGGGRESMPISAILRAMADPRANDSTKRIAQALYQQQLQQQQNQQEQQTWLARQRYEQQQQANDPLRQQQLEKGRLEIEAMRNPPPKDTDDIREYNYAKQQGYEGNFAQYQADMKRAGANNTTINNGEGNKFYNTLDEKNAATFNSLSDAGIQARSNLAQVEQLGNMLERIPTGATAALKQIAGEYGINTEGLDDIQAATALINRLVPAQRQPGSGSMSDQDLALFKQSLPRLINQPGGNATIINTLKAISQYQIQQGTIADRVANREITPAQGRQAIAELANPLAGFKPPEAGKEKQGWSNVPSDIPGVTIRRKN